MPKSLKDAAREFSDDYLLRQLYQNRDEYTSEAQKILEDEITRRNIPEEKIAPYRDGSSSDIPEYSREDFVGFDHTFSQTDILLAATILKEKKVPFFLDSSHTSDILPMETVADRVFTIHVHRDWTDRAHEALAEAFVQSEGRYEPKPLSAAEELRALSFHDIRLGTVQPDQSVEVQFAGLEKQDILRLARRLVKERDDVEQRLERPVFYYENIEELIEKLQADAELTINDLMTVMELLQVYCDQPDFPESLNETIAGLLDFLESIREP